MKHQISKLVIAFFLLLSIVAIGVSGFSLIEGYDLVNAFYMTVITISTVGFGEVKELSREGRIFTSFYILVNLGVFAYIVSVFSSYLIEGKLKNIFRNYMSDRELNKLKNHVIVCGYGRNGSKACDELISSGVTFVVIEKNPESRQSVSATSRFELLIADATRDENLKLAGIERASNIIITTPSDAANVFITLTSRALNPTINIIARASEKETEEKLLRAGANKVIMPDSLGGMFMAQLVTKPVVIEFLDLLSGVSGSGYRLEEIHYENLKKQFQNKTLRELNVLEATGATVLGIKDNIKGLIPGPLPETVIGKEDTLIVLGTTAHLARVMEIYSTLDLRISK